MLKKFLSILISTTFSISLLMPPAQAQILVGHEVLLPNPGTMVDLSSSVTPSVLRGIRVNAKDPLKFDFILDPGDKDRAQLLNGQITPALEANLKDTSTRLLKYFMATLTVPNNEIWVNLSPYEKDRIITEKFGQTIMGRDLLAQDYLLKQITASLMFPKGKAGKRFWAKVYAEAQKRFGTTQIPMNTFNKVWIMPDKAVIYENMKDNQATAFIAESRLKVLLESDYMALKKHSVLSSPNASVGDPVRTLSQKIEREVFIPILEKEVNEGANFAPLRQVYNSILLAIWYKERMKGSILSSAYVNRDKVAGVNVKDKKIAQEIWEQYVKAYKKGAVNIISEEKDEVTNQIIPRKYFVGGFNIQGLTLKITNNPAMLSGKGVPAAEFLLVRAGCEDASSIPTSSTSTIFNFSGIDVSGQAINADHFNVNASKVVGSGEVSDGRVAGGDMAMVVNQDKDMKGGIDLTKDSTAFDVRNTTGHAIHFKIDPAQITSIRQSPGLAPQVFTITPLYNLPAFLGLSKQESQQIIA